MLDKLRKAMSGYLTPAVSTNQEATMRDGEIYRTIGANNAQIEQALNNARMEVVTLQAALISEVLRTQALEETLLEAVANTGKVDGINPPTPLVFTKDMIEAKFKSKLEDYEKKIAERKAAQTAAKEAASAPKIVAPTAEEMAKVTMPTVTPNA
jgi:hypothetical protein